ncbi:MAG: hypothetical protein HQK65_06875 [Desulfamplus sp.]|nr:hypothetical protein [Desulfamplus sp.]
MSSTFCSSMYAEIVDAKSAFTIEHSRGVARFSRFLGTLLPLSDTTLDMLEVAGLLLDLGKLNIPDEILEKPNVLTDLFMCGDVLSAHHPSSLRRLSAPHRQNFVDMRFSENEATAPQGPLFTGVVLEKA